jgi:hypothetical protein
LYLPSVASIASSSDYFFKGANPGVVVGAVFGVLAGIVLLGVAIYLIVKFVKSRKRPTQFAEMHDYDSARE